MLCLGGGGNLFPIGAFLMLTITLARQHFYNFFHLENKPQQQKLHLVTKQPWQRWLYQHCYASTAIVPNPFLHTQSLR